MCWLILSNFVTVLWGTGCNEATVRHRYITILDHSSDTCFTAVHSVSTFLSEECRSLKNISSLIGCLNLSSLISQSGSLKESIFPCHIKWNHDQFLIYFPGLRQSGPLDLKSEIKPAAKIHWPPDPRSGVVEKPTSSPKSTVLPQPLLSWHNLYKTWRISKMESPDITVVKPWLYPHTTVSLLSP